MRQSAALKHILFIISLTGRRFTCASITSVAVVCRAPVTAVVAMRWTVVSLHATPAEPLDLPELSLWTGVNQMSATYVKLGMATA